MVCPSQSIRPCVCLSVLRCFVREISRYLEERFWNFNTSKYPFWKWTKISRVRLRQKWQKVAKFVLCHAVVRAISNFYGCGTDVIIRKGMYLVDVQRHTCFEIKLKLAKYDFAKKYKICVYVMHFCPRDISVTIRNAVLTLIHEQLSVSQICKVMFVLTSNQN